MTRAYLILILLLLFVQQSCNESDDNHRVRINFENFSDHHIDSLLIRSSSDENYIWPPHSSQVVFYNLKQNQIGDLQTCQDIYKALFFTAFIEDDSVLGKWVYPHYQVDSPNPQFLPNDDYLFGIFEADTSNNELIIGLITAPKAW